MDETKDLAEIIGSTTINTVLGKLQENKVNGIREGIDLYYDLVMAAQDLDSAQYQIKLLILETWYKPFLL